MSTHHSAQTEQLMLAEMQVLLAQLRTQLSILRAGMGLLAGAVSMAFILFATPWFFAGDLVWLNLPVKIGLALIALLGFWRFLSAERKIKRINKLIRELEKEDKLVGKLVV